MLWRTPLALLGLFAAFGNTIPLAPLTDDLDDVTNITTHSLDKRVNEGVRYVWRTDGRSPEVLRASQGFQTKGWTNGYPEDVSLYRHCKGAKNGASMDNDGFISTTWKYSVAEGWVLNHHKGTAWVYKIATEEGLIDVEATLKGYNPFPLEFEFAAIQYIPWQQVQGWYKYTSDGKGGAKQSQYVYNKEFSQSTYGDLPHGGAQYPLAGFPANHPAWEKLPWARYAHCRPKNAKRAEEIFAQQSLPGFDTDVVDSAEVVTVASLEARARVRGSRTPRKRPSVAGRRKKPAKKPTKKPIKKPAKKPTEATRKTPTKKPVTGTKKCTAAMKKAGKCERTTALVKCTPAMKKAGKCPATCSAAEKKANGGTCPRCTAAEKKANGGVCPTCTAAEKKKNGGKCPPKKGDCGPSKSNKARALEYVKALKAGRAGRKMKWSEGSTSTKGGKPTKTSGKTGA